MGRPFFVLDDDVRVTSAIELVLRDFGPVCIARSVAEAERQLGRHQFAGLLIDVRLPDGSGLGVLERARRVRHVTARAAVLTGYHDDRAVINRAAELDAQFIVKGGSRLHPWLRRFARRCTRPVDDERVRAWAARHALRPAELGVLLECEDGPSRSVLAARLGVSPTTVAKHVEHILEKTGDSSLFAVAMRFFCETRDPSS